jgi:hypothetical protein
MLDETIDARIDAVARDLSAALPPGQLRRRVVSQIERTKTLPSTAKWRAWQASVAAAAVFGVVVAVAIIIYMRRVPAPGLPAASAPPVQSRTDVSAKATADTRASLPIRPRPRVHAESTVHSEPVDVAGDEAIATLRVDPITVPPITQTPILVPRDPPPAAVALAPLSIAPLSPEGEK